MGVYLIERNAGVFLTNGAAYIKARLHERAYVSREQGRRCYRWTMVYSRGVISEDGRSKIMKNVHVPARVEISSNTKK